VRIPSAILRHRLDRTTVESASTRATTTFSPHHRGRAAAYDPEA
jgi:hypothetical protein